MGLSTGEYPNFIQMAKRAHMSVPQGEGKKESKERYRVFNGPSPLTLV